ncbi:MAG TPA: right-handed parallel beta-helix repeat-containing protein [Anaerolineales bacterium]|nr:right-handed parallel beta-helix repeat-containing protein [Anaerolineales bacterium]
MPNSLRVLFLSFTIVAVLLFSAFGTTPVLADDDTGTDTSETETVSAEEAPPSEEAQPTPPETVGTEEAPPSEEAQPTPTEAVVTEEAPPSEEVQPTPTETSSGDGSTTEEVVETVLEQVPENTTVTVLNSEGEALPLASQESAEAIASAYDPIWCPATQTTPTPGANGCTESFSSFTELLSFLKANEGNPAYQQAGTIYIQKDQYLGGETEIDFNDFGFTTFNQFDLTLQGGWDTTDNSVEPTDTTQFDIPIIIGSSTNPWVGSLTLNNIFITGVSYQTGLTLYTQSDITLSNVEVTNSKEGANLNAGGDVFVESSNFSENKKGGATINAGGTVSIENSTFDNNGSKKTNGFGLKVVSGGDVNLYQMSASYNEIFGADVTAEGVVSVDLSIFSGNVSYSYCNTADGGYGLKVVSQSDIFVDGINADDNYLFGAYLEGANVEVYRGTFNNNGSGAADNPVGYGLEVKSSGYATLGSLQANNNQLFGANVQAVGDVVVTDSFFNGNQGYAYLCRIGWKYEGFGLQVITNGNVTLNGVTANDNYLFGAHLEGANVEVSNSLFNENDSDWAEHVTGSGLEVVSSGDVTLSGVEANRNQKFGADIQAGGTVVVLNSFFNGNRAYTYSCYGKKTYYGYGLQVVTLGAIVLSDVTTTENNLFGTRLEGGDVTIADSVFSDNGVDSQWKLEVVGKGLEVKSTGNVSLFNVEANNNEKFGADITATGNVAIGGTNFFSGNRVFVYDYFRHEVTEVGGGFGLRVVASGSVSLNGVTATENYLQGASLQGADVSVSNSVFDANGSSFVYQPTGMGLEIKSKSSVSLSNVSASNNQLFGANIQANGNVSILTGFFSGHRTYTFAPCEGATFLGYGLLIVTTGDIALNGVEANFNNLWGASLTGKDVAIANSKFNNNVSDSSIFVDDTGLLVKSSGTVSLFNVEAKENRLIGADITAAGDVFITQSTFTDNRGFTCLFDWCPEGSIVYHGFGLKVTTPGLISLFGTNASNNNLFGAELNGALVTVENSIFNNNRFGNGLTINASDNVTLTNVTAQNNGGNGVKVTGVCEKIVQVNGGTFTDNSLYGIKVLNATLNLDGAQTFANNGSGNVFTDTSTCVVSGFSTSNTTNSTTTVENTNNSNNEQVTSGNKPKNKKTTSDKKHNIKRFRKLK